MPPDTAFAMPSAAPRSERFAPARVPFLDTDCLGDLGYPQKRLKRGDLLYRAGRPFHAVYAVRTGFFKASVTSEDGCSQVVGFHMDGEILGMEGIGTDRHAADLVALEDSVVDVISCIHLEKPQLTRELQKVMSRQLVRGQAAMVLLGAMKAEQRVASFLLDLSRRLAARGLSARDFHLRMTRDEIGSYLGLSLETVSRLFSRFQDEGLMTVQQKHIRITDMARLERIPLHEGD